MPKKPDPHSKTRKRKRKKIVTRKTKKTKCRDLWQAVLLTASLIVAAAVISIILLKFDRRKVRQEDTQVFHNEPMTEAAGQDLTAPEKAASDTAATAAVTADPEKAPASDSPTAKKPAEELKPAPEKRAPATAPEKLKSQPEKTPADKPGKRQDKPPEKPPERPPSAVTAAPAAPIPERPKYRGTVVFIIDDAGNNLRELEPFLRFPGPLTIAVLPGLPYSAEAARRIRAAGKEVFLHQPMEAIGGQAPGPGAIYSEMDADEIVAVLKRNIAEIGPVTGVNNHQGSKITGDREAMETVLGFCREQGLYFLDSRTTAETAAPAAARHLGMKIGERGVFIDNEQNRESMNRSINNGLTLAVQKGSAVMIGHTWSPELAPLLTELYRDIIDQGYTLATAGELMSR